MSHLGSVILGKILRIEDITNFFSGGCQAF